jgi:DNA-binding transcriptional LysR family regulator
MRPLNDLYRQWPGLLAAVKTADAGSFSEAARQLNLSPAAVGKSVRQLEALLDVRLFNRTTRQLALTAEGEQLVYLVRTAIEALDRVASISAKLAQARGLVRITCAVGFGRRFVLPAVGAILERHPELRIEVSLTDEAVDLVRDGFDIGFRGGSIPVAEGMVARQIARLPTVLVASAAYLARHGTPARWADLRDHRLIGLRFQSGREAEWQFEEGGRVHGFKPAAALVVSSPDVVVDAALLGQGIGAVGLHHAWQTIASGDLRLVLPHRHVPRDLPIIIYYPHRTGLAHRVRVVVDLLIELLRAHPVLADPGGTLARLSADSAALPG